MGKLSGIDENIDGADEESDHYSEDDEHLLASFEDMRLDDDSDDSEIYGGERQRGQLSRLRRSENQAEAKQCNNEEVLRIVIEGDDAKKSLDFLENNYDRNIVDDEGSSLLSIASANNNKIIFEIIFQLAGVDYFFKDNSAIENIFKYNRAFFDMLHRLLNSRQYQKLVDCDRGTYVRYVANKMITNPEVCNMEFLQTHLSYCRDSLLLNAMRLSLFFISGDHYLDIIKHAKSFFEDDYNKYGCEIYDDDLAKFIACIVMFNNFVSVVDFTKSVEYYSLMLDHYSEFPLFYQQKLITYIDDCLDSVRLPKKKDIALFVRASLKLDCERDTENTSLSRAGSFPKIHSVVSIRPYRDFSGTRELQILRHVASQLYHALKQSNPLEQEVEILHVNGNLFVATNRDDSPEKLAELISKDGLQQLLLKSDYDFKYGKKDRKLEMERSTRCKRYANKLQTRVFGETICIPAAKNATDKQSAQLIAETLHANRAGTNIKLLPVKNGAEAIQQALRGNNGIYLLKHQIARGKRHAEEFLVDIVENCIDDGSKTAIAGKKRPCMSCYGRMSGIVSTHGKYPGKIWIGNVEMQPENAAKRTLAALCHHPAHESACKNEGKPTPEYDSGSDSDTDDELKDNAIPKIEIDNKDENDQKEDVSLLFKFFKAIYDDK